MLLQNKKENKCLWQTITIKRSKMIIHTQQLINLIVKLILFFNSKEVIKNIVLGTSCKTDKRLGRCRLSRSPWSKNRLFRS